MYTIHKKKTFVGTVNSTKWQARYANQAKVIIFCCHFAKPHSYERWINVPCVTQGHSSCLSSRMAGGGWGQEILSRSACAESQEGAMVMVLMHRHWGGTQLYHCVYYRLYLSQLSLCVTVGVTACAGCVMVCDITVCSHIDHTNSDKLAEVSLLCHAVIRDRILGYRGFAVSTASQCCLLDNFIASKKLACVGACWDIHSGLALLDWCMLCVVVTKGGLS